MPDGPAPLWDHLDRVEDALASAGGLVLCTDFDGTLADITADPEAPELPDERRAALETLADHPAVAVALVSGRSLEDLTDRAPVEGASYAGNHGVERRLGGDRTVAPEATDREAAAAAVDALRDRFADVQGVEIEDKGLTLTVHYRRAGDEAAPAVREAAREVAADVEGLEPRDGKQVVELRPPTVDKGSAVAAVADRHPDDWLVAYLGDDTSDEAAFEALDDADLAVHVGDRSETAADYRLADPDDVEAFLDWLGEEGLDTLA